MFTWIVIGLAAWFTYRHFSNKKRERDIRNWSVDFRGEPKANRIKRRLPWRNL
ncbi:MAG: hypothetical protein V3V15_07725 [Sphingorhabdus sp.]